MANKSLNFIVPLVVFPFDVMISLGESDEQLKKQLSRFHGCEWDDKMKCVGLGRFFMNETNQSLIRLWNYPKNCEEYGTLQHEIFHCVTHICDRMGLKFKLGVSDETYCYMVGYLTAKIYEKI